MRSAASVWLSCAVLACAASAIASTCGPCAPLVLDVSSSPRSFELQSTPIEMAFTVRTPAVIEEVSVSASNARSAAGAVRLRDTATGSVILIAPGASDTIALCSVAPCPAHYLVLVEPTSGPASVSVSTRAAAHSNQCEDFYVDLASD